MKHHKKAQPCIPNDKTQNQFTAFLMNMLNPTSFVLHVAPLIQTEIIQCLTQRTKYLQWNGKGVYYT
jgi:hypothetical protein